VLVYDLLPVEHPEWFEASLVRVFERSLRAELAHAELVLAISDHSGRAADDWAAALAEQQATTPEPAALAEAPAVRSSGVFQELKADALAGVSTQRIDMILDIPVTLTVELGRTKIAIRNLLQLAQGSVVELDALAGEPMDVLVNGCLIAQGEVVVVNDKFGIRLTDIITPEERLRGLNR
jgi:flagellar motor switch protein FliN/FliY